MPLSHTMCKQPAGPAEDVPHLYEGNGESLRTDAKDAGATGKGREGQTRGPSVRGVGVGGQSSDTPPARSTSASQTGRGLLSPRRGARASGRKGQPPRAPPSGGPAFRPGTLQQWGLGDGRAWPFRVPAGPGTRRGGAQRRWSCTSTSAPRRPRPPLSRRPPAAWLRRWGRPGPRALGGRAGRGKGAPLPGPTWSPWSRRVGGAQHGSPAAPGP